MKDKINPLDPYTKKRKISYGRVFQEVLHPIEHKTGQIMAKLQLVY